MSELRDKITVPIFESDSGVQFVMVNGVVYIKTAGHRWRMPAMRWTPEELAKYKQVGEVTVYV